MRTIKAYLDAAKQRRENGEAGFSLVELIVVVVILGILAAVAIPIFAGIQDTAKKNAADAAAANASSQAAAMIANGDTPVVADLAKGGYTIALSGTGSFSAVDQICVTAEKDSVTSDPKGPGC